MGFRLLLQLDLDVLKQVEIYIKKKKFEKENNKK